VVKVTHYEIRVHGHIGREWSQWFDSLLVQELDDGSTRLRGALPDQAALHGLLNKIRDLGLTLLSVQRLDPRQAEPDGNGKDE
jgi:hypothetical protein